MLKNVSTDDSWTLFLDRDGVINQQKEPGYILNWNEFVFLDGVQEAMQIFAAKFQHIFIVTNQRGIGKGEMTADDLNDIHQQMSASVHTGGGRIDGIYFCPDTEAESPCRKPNPGMALQAKFDHPSVDFTKSIMVGNSISDMGFGRNICAVNIFLTTTNPLINREDDRIDFFYPSLLEFALAL